MPPLDTAVAAHLEIERAERLRWHGTLLMYLPVLPFMVILCGVVESFLVSGLPGANAPPPPWYLMIPLAIAMIGLFVSLPLAITGVIMRVIGAAQVVHLSRQHGVDAIGPWPSVAPGERIGPLIVEEVMPGRLSLIYLPAPKLAWLVLGWCAAGIFSSSLIMVAVGVLSGGIGARDLAAVIWCGVMLIFAIGFFGTRRLSFEERGSGPVFVSMYRFPGIPYWFTRHRALASTFADTTGAFTGRSVRRAEVLLAQSGIRWGLASGAFGAWKLRRLQQTVTQCLAARAT
ncbi:MAG TPA: hypothetical protein VFF65_01605 [Phycisphaerales bacterium]|nr:hypothetical protein [Phycisphaerales bacterium]